jgi:dipeptidase E
MVLLGGGGFSDEDRLTPIDRYALSLTRSARPRVCFVGTASGDATTYIEKFRHAFPSPRFRPTFVALFARKHTHAQLRELLLEQDLVYVGGGSTLNLLAVWRAHRFDALLKTAWKRGTVIAGISAGTNCFFEACSTDSFGPLAPLSDGLGWLPGSACPHFDGEKHRRPTLLRWVGAGRMPPALAIDDGAAAVFHGARLVDVVAERPGATAYRVVPTGVSRPRAQALALPARSLPAEPPANHP